MGSDFLKKASLVVGNNDNLAEKSDVKKTSIQVEIEDEQPENNIIDSEKETINQLTLSYIPLAAITIEKQVRKTFDNEYISDLASDILTAKDKQPTSPVNLWLKGDSYILAIGENRLQAMILNHDADPQNPDHIKCIVIGKYPRSKSDRLQSQIKENLLRCSLNLGELALALQVYFKEHPKANNVEAAKWCGYVNSSSGRKKIAKAKLLMNADPELVQKVIDGEMSEAKALNEIKKSDNTEEKTIEPSVYNSSEVNQRLNSVVEAINNKEDWTLNDLLALVRTEFEKSID